MYAFAENRADDHVHREDPTLRDRSMKPHTISLAALRAILLERVRDAGSYRKFASAHGMTFTAFRNFATNEQAKPGPQMLAVLGYSEEPPRYRKVER